MEDSMLRVDLFCSFYLSHVTGLNSKANSHSDNTDSKKPRSLFLYAMKNHRASCIILERVLKLVASPPSWDPSSSLLYYPSFICTLAALNGTASNGIVCLKTLWPRGVHKQQSKARQEGTGSGIINLEGTGLGKTIR